MQMHVEQISRQRKMGENYFAARSCGIVCCVGNISFGGEQVASWLASDVLETLVAARCLIGFARAGIGGSTK
jgi:hypothetical protein